MPFQCKHFFIVLIFLGNIFGLDLEDSSCELEFLGKKIPKDNAYFKFQLEKYIYFLKCQKSDRLYFIKKYYLCKQEEVRSLLRESGIHQDFSYLIYYRFINSRHTSSHLDNPWLFSQKTARLYDVVVCKGYDERKILKKATEGAIRYFHHLQNCSHLQNNPYKLLLAIFEGEYETRKLELEEHSQIWDYDLSVREKDFLFMMLSLKLILENNSEEVVESSIARSDFVLNFADISLTLEELLCNLSLSKEEFLFFNPQFGSLQLKDIFPQVELNFSLPVSKEKLLRSFLKFPPNSQKEVWSECKSHTVREGETIGEIAFFYGVPWQQIAKDNNLYNDSTHLKQLKINTGDVLRVYVK